MINNCAFCLVSRTICINCELDMKRKNHEAFERISKLTVPGNLPDPNAVPDTYLDNQGTKRST
jgi:hypothetical protein